MRLRSLLPCIALLTTCLAARADVIYVVQMPSFDGSLYADFFFIEPGFLTHTTSFTAAQLHVTQEPSASCNISGFTLIDPDSSTFLAGLSLSGSGADCSGGTIDLSGPLDHFGFYSNGASVPTMIEVTGSVAGVTPEPSSFLLLCSGLLGVAGVLKRRILA